MKFVFIVVLENFGNGNSYLDQEITKPTMKTKIRSYLSILLLAGLALVACTPAAAPTPTQVGEPSTQTPGRDSDPPLSLWLESLAPETILFQTDYEPTFFRPETFYAFGRVPGFTLYAGGLVVYLDEGLTFEDQQVFQVTLTPEETEDLYNQIYHLDFAGLESYTDYCQDQADGTQLCIADAAVTILRGLLPGGRFREVAIYANFANDQAAFSGILDLTNTYTHPQAQLYTPDRASLFIQPIDKAVGVPVLDWPLAPAIIKIAEVGDLGLWAFVLEGEALEQFLAAVPRNTGDFFFNLSGQDYATFLVPWLPGADYRAAISQAFPAQLSEGGETPTATPEPISEFPSRYEACVEYELLPPRPLRLIYKLDGDLWVWDDGLEPISLTGSGDVEQVLPAPDGSALAFVRQSPGGAASLWAAAPDGSDTRELTVGAGLTGGIELHGFSSDGLLLAFTHRLSAAKGELWAANIDGSGARRLVSQADLETIVLEPLADSALPAGVTWIPGSHQLTYDASPTFENEGIYIYVQNQVWVVEADTGVQDLLLAEGDGGQIAYSPDGAVMTIMQPTGMSFYHLANGTLTPAGMDFFAVGMGEFYAYPANIWSLDSQALLVAQPASDEAAYVSDVPVTIWRVPVDGSPAETLLTLEGFFNSFQFTPGLDKIAFWREGKPFSNIRELHIASLDGSEHIVYEVGEVLEFLGWSPGDRHFVYGQWETGAGWLGDLCGDPQPLEAAGYPLFLQWLDITRYAFAVVNEASGMFEVYIGDWSGANTLRLNLEGEPWYAVQLLPGD